MKSETLEICYLVFATCRHRRGPFSRDLHHPKPRLTLWIRAIRLGFFQVTMTPLGACAAISH